MKGNISLGDFIQDVKRELIAAQDKSGDPFYELTDVQLEVSFVLDATAKAGGKLLVVELGGETKAQQTHKVTLKLQPLEKPVADAQGPRPDGKDSRRRGRSRPQFR